MTTKEMEWIPIRFRKMTEEEKRAFLAETYSIYTDAPEVMYDCPLPDDGQEVLVTTRTGEVETDIFCNDDGCYFEYNCDPDDITAWMPMPKPYKEEKK